MQLAVRRCSKSEKGAVSVETAFSFLPFAAILFGLIHLIFYAHTVMSLQFALSKATRWGILGLTLTDTGGNVLSRESSIRQRFDDASRTYGVSPDDVTLRICPTSLPNCATSVAPGADQWMVIVAEKPPRTFFGLGTYTPTARIVVKNEPFN